MLGVVAQDGLQCFHDQLILGLAAMPDKASDRIKVLIKYEPWSARERQEIERVLCHASADALIDRECDFNGHFTRSVEA
jgi:hypothetical protein